MFILGLLGPQLMFILVVVYILYTRWASYKRSLLPIRPTPGNDLCLPIDVFQIILSFSYDKKTIERIMFDDPSYRLRRNCYNDKLQLRTLQSISCLNLDYYYATKFLWSTIEYWPKNITLTPNTLRRLRNIRLLTLSYDHITGGGCREYLSGLTQITGLRFPYANSITGQQLYGFLSSRIDELCLSGDVPLEYIRHTQQLKTLDFTSCSNITERELACCTALTCLKLGSVTKIKDSWFFTKLTNLETLQLGRMERTFDYDNLVCLTKLCDLSLVNYNGMSGFVLQKFSRLTSLYVKDNRIIIDSDIIQLTSLTSLCLSGLVRVKGDCLRNLYSLTRLKLVCTGIEVFNWGKYVRCATNLKILSIEDLTPKSTNIVSKASEYVYYPLGELCDPANYTSLRALTYLNLPEQTILCETNIHQLTQLGKLRFFNNQSLPIKSQQKKWFYLHQ